MGFVPAFSNYDGIEITDPLSKEVKRYIDEGKTMPWVMVDSHQDMNLWRQQISRDTSADNYTFDQMVDHLKADFAELKSEN